MEFQDVVDRRKMVRSFDERPVEEEKLNRIIGNIFKGPSAGFSQGTEILVLTKPQQRKLFFQQWGSEEDRRSYQQKWPNLENAPVIILVIANEQMYRDRYSQPDKTPIPEENFMPWWLIDAGMAALLGLLTSVDEELVATFTGVKSQQYIQQHFNIPGHMQTIGAILVGYQKGKYRPSQSLGRGRRSLDEIVHYNSW